MPDSPALSLIIYLFIANICYTVGEMIELMWYCFNEEKAIRIGEKLFLYGLLFSIVINMLPIVDCILEKKMHVI